MNYEEFKIQKFTELIEVSNDYSSYCRNQVYAVSAYFAMGRQIKTEFKEHVQVQEVDSIPATPWNWVKALIVGFEPSLNFGWLHPTFKKIEKKVIIQQQSQYLNVYPIELSHPSLKERHFRIPSPYSWLTSEPPTESDVVNARRKIDEYKWKAYQLAPWLVDKNAEKDFTIKCMIFSQRD